MPDEMKNLWEIALSIVGIVGAIIAFLHVLREWQASQKWKRAEQLDKFIEIFESNEQIRLACVVLDWTARRLKIGEKEVALTNRDSLLALRPHEDVGSFSIEQARMREAYDAIFAFLNRLEIALTSGLIDADPARSYFSYWVARIIQFEIFHKNDVDTLKGISSNELMYRYLEKYADIHSFNRLCTFMKVAIPEKMSQIVQSSRETQNGG